MLKPTRDEMAGVLTEMILGRIPTQIGPWLDVRETDGKNRGALVDKIISRQGGQLGEAYCCYGAQEVIDELCRYYKIERKRVAIPKGGSTQSTFGNTPARLTRKTPISVSLIFWRHGDSWRGHVGTVPFFVSHIPFRTFEFNTSAGPGVVRDGEGTHWLMRDLGPSGDMHVIGFVDIYQALMEAFV